MSIAEQAAVMGDLNGMNPQQRMEYYGAVCQSLGLNPLTRPFEYITLNDKLTLYARRDATDQLRKIHGITVQIVSRDVVDDVYVVVARATTADGRSDESTGAVPLVKEGGSWEKSSNGKSYFKKNGSLVSLGPDDRANAMMKAETKAKRRVTLSIVGLGWLDESELETIKGARYEPPAVDMPPIREITTKAPEAIDTTTRLQRDLKALRECERSLGMQVPAFSWNAKRDGVDKLQAGIDESRQRIIAAVPGLLEQVGGLLEGATDMETAAQFHRYAELVDALEVVHDGDLIKMATWLFDQTIAAFEEADVAAEPAL